MARILWLLTNELVVRAAWTTPYNHPDPEMLSKALLDMKELSESKNYGNTVAIVQSSGCGKSRMVDETAKFLFTLPFNLRPSKDDIGEYQLPSSCHNYHP